MRATTIGTQLKISVIIPSHDRATLVQRALDSVFSQTYPADEVIVIDDGSVDNTATILRTKYPSVKVLSQERQGVSAARNLGFHYASMEWLAFLDSDDEWLPEKLEAQVHQLTLHPQSHIAHTDEIWIRHGKRVNPMRKHRKRGGHIFRHCLPLCCISPSSVIIHRSLFEDVGLFDEHLPACEDYDLWLRICARFPVLYLDTPLIRKYGGHADQLSCAYWGMDRFRIHALTKILDSDNLTLDNRAATIETLKKKLEIYLSGLHKRSKKSEIREYQDLLTRYCLDTQTV